MKRSELILIVCGAVGIVVSAASLILFYDYSLCCLFEDFLVAVFTGCLFAFPSGLLVINSEVKRVRKEQTKLLADLEVQFSNISIKDSNNYIPEYMEEIRGNIVNLYKLLCAEITENYLKEGEEIRVLLDKILDFSHTVINLNIEHKKIDKEKFDSEMQRICEIKDSCLKGIKEIQEKRN